MSREAKIYTVGIVSPGDMGHAIGRELLKHGLDVIACLQDRSHRTRELSVQAGIREVPDFPELVREADLILSIVAPARAEAAAKDVAKALRAQRANTHFVDCNAVSPQTVKRIGHTFASEGGRFTDGSIIGLPPGRAAVPRLYVSGPAADLVSELDGKGIQVMPIGPEIGQASGIKMCYAAMTKGLYALQFGLLVVAERLNLLEELLDEFEFSQSEMSQRLRRELAALPAKANRWVGEMDQIAATFEDAGVTPKLHEGAAAIFQMIGQSALGSETPETIERSRTLEDTIEAISKSHQS